MNKQYKIICSGDGRVLANLELDGTLVIRHDHFEDEEKFDLTQFIEALDKWAVRREISHVSKRGLNSETLEALNTLQKGNPGKTYLKFSKENPGL